ncbi:DNA polymerase ligase N-terminal domain-containing protein [Chloroflexota bacterium]
MIRRCASHFTKPRGELTTIQISEWYSTLFDQVLGEVWSLAIQVENHPIDYIDFTGRIPEGEYGAGTVEIWDKGEYTLNDIAPDRLELTPRGDKLYGGYILLHTNGKNWLLIKRKS